MDDDKKTDETHIKLMTELKGSSVYQKAIETVDDDTRAKIERRVAAFFAGFSRDLLVPLTEQVGSSAFKRALLDHLQKRPTGAAKTDGDDKSRRKTGD